jgi:hypothetical protein
MPRADGCRLDRAHHTATSRKASQALLDPDWLGGPAAAVKRTDLRVLVILRSDATSPAVVELSKDEALRTLEAGEAAGARKALAAGQVQPFYNPHLLGAGPEKIEAQRAFFGRLLESAKCYLFNSGVAGADKLKDLVPPGR